MARDKCDECGKDVDMSSSMTLEGEDKVHLGCFTPDMPESSERQGAFTAEKEKRVSEEMVEEAMSIYLQNKNLI